MANKCVNNEPIMLCVLVRLMVEPPSCRLHTLRILQWDPGSAVLIDMG